MLALVAVKKPLDTIRNVGCPQKMFFSDMARVVPRHQSRALKILYGSSHRAEFGITGVAHYALDRDNAKASVGACWIAAVWLRVLNPRLDVPGPRVLGRSPERRRP